MEEVEKEGTGTGQSDGGGGSGNERICGCVMGGTTTYKSSNCKKGYNDPRIRAAKRGVYVGYKYNSGGPGIAMSRGSIICTATNQC